MVAVHGERLEKAVARLLPRRGCIRDVCLVVLPDPAAQLFGYVHGRRGWSYGAETRHDRSGEMALGHGAVCICTDRDQGDKP